MHARTSIRCILWIAGGVVATLAAALASPVLGVAIAIGIIVFFGVAVHSSSDFYLRLIRRSPSADRRVALTFDDGPDAERTPEVLAALDESGAKATFFMIGRRAEERPDLVRAVLERGHEIGGHSFSHARTLPFALRRRQQREVAACAEALERAGAPTVRWYRPPMGFASPGFARAIERTALRPVNWSVASRDLADPDAKRIAERVLDRVRGGDIVLMHDGSDRNGAGPKAVPDAVRRIVSGLRERGLEPVTLSELFQGDGEEGAAGGERRGSREPWGIHGGGPSREECGLPRPMLGDAPRSRRETFMVRALWIAARLLEFVATIRYGVALPVRRLPPEILRAGPVILVANHRSLLDTPFLRWSFPHEIRRRLVTVGGYDFFEPRGSRFDRFVRTWVLRFIVHGYRVWMIDRRIDGAAHLAPLTALLESGWTLLLYPEGRRSRSGELGPMQPGAALLARRTGAPVVPLFIDGTQRVLPAGRGWPRQGAVHIRAGTPMRLREGEHPEAFMLRVRAAIDALARVRRAHPVLSEVEARGAVADPEGHDSCASPGHAARASESSAPRPRLRRERAA